MQTLRGEESDSEADCDYVPSEGEDSVSSDDEPEAKRTRTNSPKPLDEAEEAAKKKEHETMWAKFQASLATPPLKVENPSTSKTMVKIEKRYRFAGEEVVEVIEVVEDSQEAQKWPLWQPAESSLTSAAPSAVPESVPSQDDGPSASFSAPSRPPPATPTTGKKPGPRKPKTVLSALPTPSSQKLKKLSTLDKSAMDWRSHLSAEQDSGLKDELEANRRSGGYIEKLEFLQRVEGRKEEALEASKSGKRRRT